MKWVPCTTEHLKAVPLQASQTIQDIRGMLLADEQALEQILPTHARALVAGEGCLAVVGVWPQWPGVGAAWALLSEESRKHPFSLARGILRELRAVEDREGYHRIQATCDADDRYARDFLAWLGFVWEGRMRGYGMAREDHILVARVR